MGGYIHKNKEYELNVFRRENELLLSPNRLTSLNEQMFVYVFCYKTNIDYFQKDAGYL